MKIGLLSDTHSFIDDQILTLLRDSDEIWHAGDVGVFSVIESLRKIAPVRGVFGNIDSAEIRKEFPEDNVFEANGLKVAMTHIGGYPGRYSKHGRTLIEEVNPDIFITGHSHILRVMPDKKYICFI